MSFLLVAAAFALNLCGCCKKKIVPDAVIIPPPVMVGESVPVRPKPVHFDIADITFEYDSAALSNIATGVLYTNAYYLHRYRHLKIIIEGHCDQRGTVAYNLALGQRRGQAVKTYYESLGIGGDRMRVVSYGEEMLACEDETESCYAQNRRAVMTLEARQ